MAYKPDEDKILWESEPLQFKPKATLRAQIKTYQNSIPKLILVEQGEGFGGKQYTGMILKRVEITGVDQVMELLKIGKTQLIEVLKTWEKKEKTTT